MDSVGESLQTAAIDGGIRFLSLIVGLGLGFLAAAWFYGAGGALTIAGRQIGPDILQQADFTSNSSAVTTDHPPEAGGSPSYNSAGSPSYNSAGSPSPSSTLADEKGAVSKRETGTVNTPAVTGNSSPAVTKNNVPFLTGNSYIQLRWPK
jgi:hypothetical protein